MCLCRMHSQPLLLRMLNKQGKANKSSVPTLCPTWKLTVSSERFLLPTEREPSGLNASPKTATTKSKAHKRLCAALKFQINDLRFLVRS